MFCCVQRESSFDSLRDKKQELVERQKEDRATVRMNEEDLLILMMHREDVESMSPAPGIYPLT